MLREPYMRLATQAARAVPAQPTASSQHSNSDGAQSWVPPVHWYLLVTIRLELIVLKMVSVDKGNTEKSVLLILAIMPPNEAKLMPALLQLRSQITLPDTHGRRVPSRCVRVDPHTGFKKRQHLMQGNRGSNLRNKTGEVKKAEKGGARERRAVTQVHRQVQHLPLHPPAETGLGSSVMNGYPIPQ